MVRVSPAPRRLRESGQAGGRWLAERGTGKVDASDTSGPLGRLEALETLKLGILGSSRCSALEHVAGEVPALEVSTFRPSGAGRRTSTTESRAGGWRRRARRSGRPPPLCPRRPAV